MGLGVHAEGAAGQIVGVDHDGAQVAVAVEMKSFTASGQSIDVEMLEIFAKGPVVVTSRVDTVKAPGKPDQVYKIAGVFIVKGGTITEWTDFLFA